MKYTLLAVARIVRIKRSLENLGVKVAFTRRLMRMTNVRFVCGRLDDATCHYERRFEISGNTYPVKDLLKSAGYRWDATNKVWASPHDHLVNPFDTELIPAMVRKLKGR